MFNTLESTWDRSARRGWSTAASFGFQALALSLLLAVPFVWIQGPPRVAWLQPSVFVSNTAESPRPVVETHRVFRASSVSNILNGQLLQPQWIPRQVRNFDDSVSGPAPDVANVIIGRVGSNTEPYPLGNNVAAAMPKPLPPSHPPRVSHWAEGNLIYRVQPLYPPLARQVRIQGPVLLRAIVSKSGTIEHLTVISGHPMLIPSALSAVQQWRYRPYMLNGEPIEIETEITVNFVLSQ